MDFMRAFLRNTLFGVGERSVHVATRLILVPIVTSHIGLDGYGIWAILVMIIGSMRLGVAGISSAFQKYVAEGMGRGDYQKTNRLLSSGVVGIFFLSLCTLIPVLFFSDSLVEAAGVPGPFAKEASMAFSIVAIAISISNTASVFQATIMGVQRIDIVKQVGIVFLIGEALAITLLLRAGFGLSAMATVMAISELGKNIVYWRISKRIAPGVQLRRELADRSVIPELLRFGGTYQLSNLLEVVGFATILPVLVLKFFGAEAAGIFAISERMVMAGLIFSEALLLPLLSSASMVQASESYGRLAEMFLVAWKGALVLSIIPLAFVASFGQNIVFAWVNAQHVFLGVSLWCYCVARMLRSMAMICYVFYRASGRASADIARQCFRVGCLALLFLVQSSNVAKMSYLDIMCALVVVEAIGLLIIFKPLKITMPELKTSSFVFQVCKIILCTAVVVFGSVALIEMTNAIPATPRLLASIQVILGGASFFVLAVLSLLFARYFSRDELMFVRSGFK